MVRSLSCSFPDSKVNEIRKDIGQDDKEEIKTIKALKKIRLMKKGKINKDFRTWSSEVIYEKSSGR